MQRARPISNHVAVVAKNKRQLPEKIQPGYPSGEERYVVGMLSCSISNAFVIKNDGQNYTFLA